MRRAISKEIDPPFLFYSHNEFYCFAVIFGNSEWYCLRQLTVCDANLPTDNSAPSVKNSHPDVFEFTWHFVTTGELDFEKCLVHFSKD